MVRMNGRKVFVDTNILVYANLEEAPLHTQARDALDSLWNEGAELWISRQVLREYLAANTRPRMFPKPLSISTLIARVRFMQTQFYVADEALEVTEKLLALLTEISCGGKQVHDANIVATTLVNGMGHLLTHNVGDFARFSDYITIMPLAPTSG